jgi:hypothetical protein
MKIDFEKIVFYFMLILVSGSIGYALKPDENTDKKTLEEKYINQQRVCAQAIHTMEYYNKQKYHYNAKTAKQIAIDRMMRN